MQINANNHYLGMNSSLHAPTMSANQDKKTSESIMADKNNIINTQQSNGFLSTPQVKGKSININVNGFSLPGGSFNVTGFIPQGLNNFMMGNSNKKN